jgi:hypothetical protein
MSGTLSRELVEFIARSFYVSEEWLRGESDYPSKSFSSLRFPNWRIGLGASAELIANLHDDFSNLELFVAIPEDAGNYEALLANDDIDDFSIPIVVFGRCRRQSEDYAIYVPLGSEHWGNRKTRRKIVELVVATEISRCFERTVYVNLVVWPSGVLADVHAFRKLIGEAFFENRGGYRAQLTDWVYLRRNGGQFSVEIPPAVRLEASINNSLSTVGGSFAERLCPLRIRFWIMGVADLAHLSFVVGDRHYSCVFPRASLLTLVQSTFSFIEKRHHDFELDVFVGTIQHLGKLTLQKSGRKISAVILEESGSFSLIEFSVSVFAYGILYCLRSMTEDKSQRQDCADEEFWGEIERLRDALADTERIEGFATV